MVNGIGKGWGVRNLFIERGFLFRLYLKIVIIDFVFLVFVINYILFKCKLIFKVFGGIL